MFPPEGQVMDMGFVERRPSMRQDQGPEAIIRTAGHTSLRTDGSNDVFGVRQADALGDAAALAQTRGAPVRDAVTVVESSRMQTVGTQAPTFGTLAGRREGNTNLGQKERRKTMDWRTETRRTCGC